MRPASFRFSLRTLVIGLVLIALTLGIGRAIWRYRRGNPVNAYAADLAVVRQIRADVVQHDALDDLPTRALAWAADEGYYRRIVSLYLESKSPIELPAELARLDHVKFVKLLGHVDRETIERLASLPRLSCLVIRNSKLAAGTLAELAEFRQLKILDLGGSGVQASAIAELLNCSPIEELNLEGNLLEDDEVETLIELYTIWRAQCEACDFRVKVSFHEGHISADNIARLQCAGVRVLVWSRMHPGFSPPSLRRLP